MDRMRIGNDVIAIRQTGNVGINCINAFGLHKWSQRLTRGIITLMMIVDTALTDHNMSAIRKLGNIPFIFLLAIANKCRIIEGCTYIHGDSSRAAVAIRIYCRIAEHCRTIMIFIRREHDISIGIQRHRPMLTILHRGNRIIRATILAIIG